MITRLRLLAFLMVLLMPALANADSWAKINDIRVDDDGSVQVWSTVLDRYGRAPEVSDFEFIEVSLGEANSFSGEDLQADTFANVGPGTEYVLIIPGYEGFGINNAEAAAQGAGWFQRTFLNEETDTALVLLYGDGVLPHEGDASELAAAFGEPDGIMRAARPYMLAALDEAIRYFDDLPRGKRRVIVLVGTGLDVQLGEASMVRADTLDLDSARRQVLNEHQAILREYMEEVNAVGARIYSLGFNETRPDYLEVMNVLARKTGGTYRRVRNIGVFASSSGDGSSGVYELLGQELDRELVLTPQFSADPGKEYEVWGTFRFYDDSDNRVLADISTRRYWLTIDEQDKKLNLIPYLIAVAVILIIVFLLLVLAFVLSKKLKKKKDHQGEANRLRGIIAEGDRHCQTCFRPMEAEWTQCLFCASGMPPLPEQPQAITDAEEARKALDELEGRTEPVEVLVAGTAGAAAAMAAAAGKRQCPTCFRIMENDWAQCLFCAGGAVPLPTDAPMADAGAVAEPVPMYGAYGAAPAAAPPAAAAQQAPEAPATVALSPGVGACPQCNRPVPADWSECLYCKAGV